MHPGLGWSWNPVEPTWYPRSWIASSNSWLGDMTDQSQGPEEQDASFGMKLVLTLFPFVLVFVFLLAEWWIRGRS